MATIRKIYDLFREYPIVTTDTRNCTPGSLFFALKGDHFNGNAYVEQALEKGCAYAITDEEDKAVNDRIIYVQDGLQTLQDLARFHRVQLGLPVIGITGTNGKTTTKELLAAVLSTQYNVLYTQGNLNNHIGVPLTLLQLKPEHELAIIEMGANHPGEIKTLSEIALPDYGLITNVGKAHLEGFGSFEGVVSTKGELYDFLRKTGGKAFVDHDNPHLTSLAKKIDKVYYGKTPDSFVWGGLKELTPYVTLEWHCSEGDYLINTQLIGVYNINNVLTATAVGKFLGIYPENINRAIEGYAPQNNRSQWQKSAHNELFIDAYNANPTSMMAALESFREVKAPRKALILGDMKELGENSREEHRKIVDYILREMAVDQVFLCGPCFKEMASEGMNAYETTEALLSALDEEPLSGYFVLIKGSRSMNLEKTIEKL